MRKVLFAATVLLVLALALPTQSEGQNKDKNKGGLVGGDLSPAAAKAVEAAVHGKELNGVLTAVDADSTTVTLRIDIPIWDRNPNFKGGAGGNKMTQQMQKLMSQQNRSRNSRNPFQAMQQQMQAQAQMQKMMAQMATQGAKGGGEGGKNEPPFKMTHQSKEFKLEADKAVVKRGKAPAKFEELEAGMTVKVFPATTSAAAKDAGKKADDLDLEGSAAIKIKVREIVIQDAPLVAVENPLAANADKKKKKK